MSGRAPETKLWDLPRGALRTRALAVVAELRVADALTAGLRPVADVARDGGAHPDTLHLMQCRTG